MPPRLLGESMGISIARLKEIDSLYYLQRDLLYAAEFEIDRKWLKIHHGSGRRIEVSDAPESFLIWESPEAYVEAKAVVNRRWQLEEKCSKVKFAASVTSENLDDIEAILNEIEGMQDRKYRVEKRLQYANFNSVEPDVLSKLEALIDKASK